MPPISTERPIVRTPCSTERPIVGCKLRKGRVRRENQTTFHRTPDSYWTIRSTERPISGVLWMTAFHLRDTVRMAQQVCFLIKLSFHMSSI